MANKLEESFCLCFPSAGITGAPGFLHGKCAGDLNSSSHAYTASTLLTVLFLQSLKCIYSALFSTTIVLFSNKYEFLIYASCYNMDEL